MYIEFLKEILRRSDLRQVTSKKEEMKSNIPFTLFPIAMETVEIICRNEQFVKSTVYFKKTFPSFILI